MKKTFPEMLKWARTARGWSQEDLAKATGLSRVSITNYECGNQVPTVYQAIKLADLLGFSLDRVSPKQPDPKEIRKVRLDKRIKKLEGDLKRLRGENE